MRYHVANQLFMLLGTVIGCLVLGCSNSEGVNNEVVAFLDIEEDAIPLSTEINYLPLDDSEYPYAGIPRIVIETENNKPIADRETEIPAKLQVWGAGAPESEVMELTIRGRGNTSWTDMPKKSYKIEFINKQSMLGMPKDRDWALIANYADKTLMKNYLAYHLSAELGAYYAPRCEFVELYLNKEYLGVYLLTETIKTGKKRIVTSENNTTFIVEFDEKYRSDDNVFFSDILSSTKQKKKPFTIHEPKKISANALDTIQEHIHAFEKFLLTIKNNQSNDISSWLDINEFTKHYWIQEFSKNPDGNFFTSVYFSWEPNSVIKMGPVWDFDLAYGGFDYEEANSPKNWYTRNTYWHSFLFKDSLLKNHSDVFWTKNHKTFQSTLNSIDSIATLLHDAAHNNFKRWNILTSTTNHWHPKAFSSYDEAIADLKKWIVNRIEWIDFQINP